MLGTSTTELWKVCKLHVLQTMAEAMTPGQGTEAKEREVMLRRIAKLAKQQGSFHLACKKYTQVI